MMRRSRLPAILLVAALVFSGCLSLPEGLNVIVSEDGCLPDGTCPYGQPAPFGRNYYWAPTRTLVFAPNQGMLTMAHELAHAHQHAVILEDLGREPTNVNLEDWHLTGEGKDWLAQGFRFDDVWQRTTTPNALEDNANTVAAWLVRPEELKRVSPERYAWAERWIGR